VQQIDNDIPTFCGYWLNHSYNYKTNITIHVMAFIIGAEKGILDD